jgi:hypothetical protein
MYDALITLQALTTATTTPVTGTAFNTLTGNRVGMDTVIEWIYPAAAVVGLGTVWTPKVQVSPDNTIWNDWSVGIPITATTATASGKFNTPVRTTQEYPWIRTVLTPSPTTGTPSFAFSCRYGVSWP